MEFASPEHSVSLAGAARITVVGVGGGGGNAVQHMIDSGLCEVHFICANTDAQALDRGASPCKIQIGERLTKGLGAGANPQIGRDAALESVSVIKEALGDADMVFVTAGMGGGTGTGAAPVIARTAKDLGTLTVGVVTKPFDFEGPKRRAAAEAGIAEFSRHVDCLITIPNDRLLTFAPKNATMAEMLKKANDVLYFAVKGISDVIMKDGLFNLDFADVRTVMSESGLALMGTGSASGENRAREAATRAITCPLLEDVSVDGAKAVLYNITAGLSVTTEEIREIGDIIKNAVHPEANIIVGMVYDEQAEDELRITVIATGIEATGDIPAAAPKSKGGTYAVPGAAVHDFPRPSRPAASPQREPAVRPAETNTAAYAPPQSAPTRGHLVEQWHGDKKDLPAYVRRNRALGGQTVHRPGDEDFIFDEEEFEMPAFIRRQAD